MNAKIERINSEIDKTKGKISEFGAKLRELEKQKTELENAEIVEAVRGMDISLADLASMLKKNAAKGGAATSGQNVPKSATPNNENKEDNN
jgi:seryl-tRNA synthetase